MTGAIREPAASGHRRHAERRNQVKCVVWDLDDTLWHGTLLENDSVRLRDGVHTVITALDARGILQSVASRNDPAAALEKLRDFGLDEYFLHPQIGWGAKSAAVGRIAETFGFGLDTVLFIDDQPFERAEVAAAHPAVRTVDPAGLPGLLDRPDLTPRFITEDSRNRRAMYRADIGRRRAEDDFDGPPEAFLASLGMRLVIRPATAGDLQRAEELTLRTNQLNSTGYTYSYDELDVFRRSPRHTLLVAELEDRFGGYGTVGLALLERAADAWTIKLLLMSCRVLSRGLGSVVLYEIMAGARRDGVRLRGDFVRTERNRAMHVAYRLAGFEEVERRGDTAVLEDRSPHPPSRPGYVDVTSPFDEPPPK